MGIQQFDNESLALIRKVVRQYLHENRGGYAQDFSPRETTQPRRIRAKITSGAAMSGNPNRWKYAWEEVERIAGGWQTKTGGLTGTTSTGFALNSREANNPGTTGMMGNSVNTASTGTTLSAVQGGPVVWLDIEYDTDGNPQYSFDYENSVECS